VKLKCLLIIDFFSHEENYNSAFNVKNLILIDTLSKLDYFKIFEKKTAFMSKPLLFYIIIEENKHN